MAIQCFRCRVAFELAISAYDTVITVRREGAQLFGHSGFNEKSHMASALSILISNWRFSIFLLQNIVTDLSTVVFCPLEQSAPVRAGG